MSLIFIIPWATAIGVAYYFVMETNGSRLKKSSPTDYEKIANDKDGSEVKKLKDGLTKKKELRDASKTKLDELKTELGKEDNGGTEDEKAQLKILEETLVKQEAEVAIAENVDQSLWMPVLSISNIAWTTGTLLGVGIVLHFITKKLMGITSSKTSSE